MLTWKHLQALTAVALVAAGTAPTSGEVVWTTNPGIPTTFFDQWNVKPCSDGPGTVGEAADDFNVVGTIERILADGQDCQGCFYGPADLVGVNVRFFAWTANGPGALQAEHFIARDDPNLTWAPACCIDTISVTLPEPFAASGQHYVSVQVVVNRAGSWQIVRRNVGDTMGGETYHRTNGGVWQPWSAIAGTPPVDLSFQLEGTIEGETSPRILSITSHPIAPSARLRVDGLSFGSSGQDRTVRIDGVDSFVTQWTDDTIIAYVPEAVEPGERSFRIIDTTTQQILAETTIDVQSRVRDGRVRWRFAVDADLMIHRPDVGPDGSVYVNDYNRGRLYKLAPDGGLEWIVDALRGQVGLGSEGRVVVGEDGTIYAVVNPLGPTTDVVAYHPDGTLKWVFVEPHSYGAAAGPGIGPDGNVYVAFHDADQDSLGIVSLTPDGTLRWSNNGAPPLYEHGAIGVELAFGASTPGGAVDQVVLNVDRDLDGHLYAFDTSSGDQNWAQPTSVIESVFMQFQLEPHTGLDGTIYMTEFTGFGGLGWGLQAFDPSDGSRLWRFDPGIAADVSPPIVGPDGTIYISWDISRVTAVTPAGTGIWTHVDFGGIRAAPSISPVNDVLLVAGGTFGQPGSFIALDTTDGAERWKVQLPHENGDVVPDARALFTDDGSTAYFPTVILADPEPFQYSYLYALEVAEPSGPAQDLNGDGVVGFDDLIILLATWGPCAAPPAECAADFDGDGTIGFGDLVTLLSVWGPA